MPPRDGTGVRYWIYAYAGSGNTEPLSQSTAGGDTYHYAYGRSDQNGLPVIEELSLTTGGSTYNAYIAHDPTGLPVAIQVSTDQWPAGMTSKGGAIYGLVDLARRPPGHQPCGHVRQTCRRAIDRWSGQHEVGVRLSMNFGTRSVTVTVPDNGTTTVTCAKARSARDPHVLVHPTEYWSLTVS